MRNLTTGIIVVLLLGAMILINARLSQVPKDDNDEDEHAPAQSQQQPAKTPPPAPPLAQAPHGAGSVAPIEGFSVGPANAPVSITVGYHWNDKLQSNPAALSEIVGEAKRWGAQPNHHVDVVCLDVPPEFQEPSAKSVPGPGIYVKGPKPVSLPGNPGADIQPEQFSGLLSTLK